MADESPQINPVDPGPVPEPTSSWPSSGAGDESTVAAIAVAEAEPVTESEPVAEAEPIAGAETSSEDVVADADAVSSIDDGTVFLASLAQAMRAAATTERTRLTEDIDKRRDAHVAGINARRDEEAARMRELADEDRKAIDAWVEAEQQRIAEERDRRNAALESDLDTSLSEHGAQVDREIERVEAAIVVYRQAVDDYFGRLESDSDPVAIAQHAGRRPVFPDLEGVGMEPEAAAAAAEVADTSPDGDAVAAVAEESADAEAPDAAEADAESAATPLVGVMDGDKPKTKLAQAWAAWNESTKSADESAAAAPADDAFPTPYVLTTPSSSASDVPVDDPAGPGTEASLDQGSAVADPAPDVVPVAAGAWQAPAEAAPQTESSSGALGWFRRDRDRDHGGR